MALKRALNSEFTGLTDIILIFVSLSNELKAEII